MPDLPPASSLTTALADRYRIERELGGGGMSRVFVADEVALGRRVVVKVIAPEQMEGVSAERFTREMKLAARLQQANIVPVPDRGRRRRPALLHDAVRRGRVAPGATPQGRRPARRGGEHPARRGARARLRARAGRRASRHQAGEHPALRRRRGRHRLRDRQGALGVAHGRRSGTADRGRLTRAGSRSVRRRTWRRSRRGDPGHRSSRRSLRLGRRRVGAARRNAPVPRTQYAARDDRRARERGAGAARRATPRRSAGTDRARRALPREAPRPSSGVGAEVLEAIDS